MRTAQLVRKASRGVRGLARLAIGALFVYSGWVKLRDPRPAAEFLQSVMYADLAWVIPVLAVIEVSLGIWLLTGVGAGRAATVAFGAFIAFGVLHGFAIASPDVTPPCGCLGQVEAVQDSPPWVWLAMNALLACFAGFVAFMSQTHHSPESTPVDASEGADDDSP